jgi:hypothetical protein
MGNDAPGCRADGAGMGGMIFEGQPDRATASPSSAGFRAAQDGAVPSRTQAATEDARGKQSRNKDGTISVGAVTNGRATDLGRAPSRS